MFLTASKFEEESKQAGAIQKFLLRKEHTPDDEILPVVKSEAQRDTVTLELSEEPLKFQVASSSSHCSSQLGHNVEAGESSHSCTPARQASVSSFFETVKKQKATQEIQSGTGFFATMARKVEAVGGLKSSEEKPRIEDSDSDLFSSGSTSGSNSDVLDVHQTQSCDKCGKQIPLIELLEHSDFHVAAELQREWNRQVSSTHQGAKNDSPKKSNINVGARKRGRPRKKINSMPKITRFFS